MADWTGRGITTADLYRQMAERELHGLSPTYEALCLGVAADPELCALIDQLPGKKRQPNLLLGATRFLGGPVGSFDGLREWLVAHWDETAALVRVRRTQTNEARRCATLLPVLAAIDGPLALLEVGASAGLCLYPDRYAYRYDVGGGEHFVGRSTVEFRCAVTGPAPLPGRLPEVVWRAGLDLNPLDVRDEQDVRWLEALVWPEQTDRAEVLRGAVEIARTDPPRIEQGDLLTDLPALVADAPPDAALVLFHSAVLAYLGPDEREQFADVVANLGREVHWVTNEAPGVVAGTADVARRGKGFVLTRDGVALARTGPHGQSLEWLARRDNPPGRRRGR